jgi:hypothetical protein
MLINFQNNNHLGNLFMKKVLLTVLLKLISLNSYSQNLKSIPYCEINIGQEWNNIQRPFQTSTSSSTAVAINQICKTETTSYLRLNNGWVDLKTRLYWFDKIKNGLTLDEAKKYCSNLKLRLPNDSEFNKAVIYHSIGQVNANLSSDYKKMWYWTSQPLDEYKNGSVYPISSNSSYKTDTTSKYSVICVKNIK